MTTYADQATLLRALTQLHEETITDADALALFGGAVLIRELSARQRQNANDAATAENPDQPDNTLYRAMLVQQSVVDPTTGTPYPDGRTGDDGAPLIDPRTRATFFTIADVLLIADGRADPILTLTNRIMALSALGPTPLFRGGHAADRGERDQGAGDPPTGDAAEPDSNPRSGDADERGALPGDTGGDAGATT